MDDNGLLTVHILGSSPLVREGLRALLEQQHGITTRSSEWLVAREPLRLPTGAAVPDLFIAALDRIEMTNGEVSAQIGRVAKAAPVLLLASFDDRRQVGMVIAAGAQGCVSSSSSSEILIEGIRRVAAGHGFICPFVSDVMVGIEPAGRATAAAATTTLSTREREVLLLVAQGRTNAEMAAELALSVKTINAHRANLMRKLGARNASMLVREGIRRGLVPG